MGSGVVRASCSLFTSRFLRHAFYVTLFTSRFLRHAFYVTLFTSFLASDLLAHAKPQRRKGRNNSNAPNFISHSNTGKFPFPLQ
ncbi:MAG: hypothetical protein KME64_19655 [Scytonematopsis contorta HA4267-MV1]|nr:hypothetical protein [Scytonematopsis contorta HA4267-MV1]